jgi:flagellar motor switch protein FliN/FliY
MKTRPIGEIKVPLMVVLGTKDVRVDELATIGEGTIIELESLAGEPVVLYASGEPIALGEVVVIDENFGIRVTSLSNVEEAANGG